MKTAAIVLAAMSLLGAGAATAAERVTDLDYMKAARCKGIATSLGSDTTALDAFLKVQSRSRIAYVIERGEQEMNRGKRDAAKSDLKDRTGAELSGPCMAYAGPGKDMAATTSATRSR
jgi:hypothetical protein